MILAYLILAHLIGDFILQPNKLIAMKYRGSYGILVHVCVHFAVNIALLSPFVLSGNLQPIYAVAGICLTHFLFDRTKIRYESDEHHHNKVKPFLFDQFMHTLVLLIAFIYLHGQNLVLPEGGFYNLYQNIAVPVYFALLIVTTLGLEIYRFQFAREKEQKATLKIKYSNILFRGINFSLAYMLVLTLGSYALS